MTTAFQKEMLTFYKFLFACCLDEIIIIENYKSMKITIKNCKANYDDSCY